MPNKVKTYVVLADIHYPKYHKPTLNAVLHYLDENKVDGIVFQGDQLDMENMLMDSSRMFLFQSIRDSLKELKDIGSWETTKGSSKTLSKNSPSLNNSLTTREYLILLDEDIKSYLSDMGSRSGS